MSTANSGCHPPRPVLIPPLLCFHLLGRFQGDELGKSTPRLPQISLIPAFSTPISDRGAEPLWPDTSAFSKHIKKTPASRRNISPATNNFAATRSFHESLYGLVDKDTFLSRSISLANLAEEDHSAVPHKPLPFRFVAASCKPLSSWCSSTTRILAADSPDKS